MKITKIETFKHWIEWCNRLFAKVSTDEGPYGWDEGSPHGAIESVETAVHERAGARSRRAGSIRRRAALAGHVSRLAVARRPHPVHGNGALDIALWDLEGKRLGVPVYRLLGGPFRDRLRVYASHWLAGVDTPEQAREGAREAVRRGFTAFKWGRFNAKRLRENEARAIAHAAELMAAAVLASLPVLVLYVSLERHLVQGITAGAVKG